MNKFTFHRGLHLNIDSKEFVVLRRLSDRRLQFENVQDGEILTLNNAEVLAKYAKNEIRFVATQDPDGQPSTSRWLRKSNASCLPFRSRC